MSEAAQAYDAVTPSDDFPHPSTRTDEELVIDLLAPDGPVSTERAGEILQACRGLAGLLTAEPASMVREGASPDETVVLLAALEMGRRIAEREIPRFDPLKKLPAVAAFLALRYMRLSQEVMGALFLNRQKRLLHHELLYRGTLSKIAVEPRTVLREALRQKARAVVLFHTHPSGDPSPSLEDIAFTRRMAKAADIMGLELLDHLIIGSPTRWVSLRERCGLCHAG